MTVEDRSLLGGNYLHAVLVFLREADASRSCRLQGGGVGSGLADRVGGLYLQ